MGGQGRAAWPADLLDASFSDSNILATFIMTPRSVAAFSYRGGDRWKETLLVPTGCRFTPGVSGPGCRLGLCSLLCCLSPLPETCPLLSLVDSYLIMHVLSHCPDSECFQLRVVRTYTDNGVTQIWSMDPTPVMAAQLGQRCHNPDPTAREWVGALSSFSLSCLFIAFQTRLTQHRYSAAEWALEVC